jgi:phage gpG-like protein
MIKGSVSGGRETAKKLRGEGKRVREAVRKTMGRLVLELMVKVKRDKLSGPGEGQALNVRTGRLRRSITQRIEVHGNDVEGVVGTNVEYGKFHEYGFGQKIKDELKKHREGFKAGLTANKPVLSDDNLPPGSFLRSALKEMKPRIREEFRQAVKEVSTNWRVP